jgi:selenocysteine-specific elongation factor
LAQGTPTDVLFEAALALHASPIKDVIAQSRLESTTAESALHELLNTGRLIVLEEGMPKINSDLLVIAAPHWNSLFAKGLQMIESYHKTYSLRRGIPREELKSRLKLTPRVFNAALKKMINDGFISDHSAFLAKLEHEITFDNNQQTKIRALIRRFEQSPFSPPSLKDVQAELGEEILNALVELDELIVVSPDVIFRKQDYDDMVRNVRNALIQNGKITLAEARDLFSTSRKYAQALLEHLDTIGITMRDGDFRKLIK